MKKLLFATALLTGLSATAFAAENNINERNNTHSIARQDKSATRTFSVFNGVETNKSWSRSGCDLSSNGAAKLDACAADGMAAGGSNHGSSNSRQ